MIPKKILFVSHDANRTGAPILLLRFIKLISQLPEYECTILSGKTGPLIADFNNTCKTYIWEPEFIKRPKSDTLNYYYKISKIEKIHRKIKLNFYQKNLLKTLKSKAFDVIIANTIASAPIIKGLHTTGYTNITSYIHELQYGLNTYVSANQRDFLLQNSKNFWVPSNAVKVNLNKNHNISLSKIEVLISANDIVIDNLKSIPKIKSNNIKNIGCVGTLDFRKGADIFIEVAKKTIESYGKKVIFNWYGADLTSDYYKTIQKQINDWGLQLNIIINGNTENIIPKIAQLDIFLLTSREDPYPLVILEAAMLNVPIIAFDENAGGTVELIENQAGIIIPYLNINEMAKQCKYLLENDEIRQKISQKAQEKVLEKHNINKALSNFMYLLNNSF